MGRTMKALRWLAFAAVLAGPATAAAQNHDLHMAQAGALIDYAKVETRLLYSVMSARVFDLALANASVEELARTLSAAKKSLDRTDALLPESMSGQSPRILKVRDQLVRAERQLEAFKSLLEQETAAMSAEEDEEDEEAEEGEEPRRTDWAGMKTSVAWLAKDVGSVDASYSTLAKSMGIRLKTPPAPRGARPE